MNKEEFDSLEKLSDRELFDFITKKDSSQRKWVAIHLPGARAHSGQRMGASDLA